MSSTPWMPCLVCNYLRQHWHTHLADLADLADLFNEGRKSEHMSRCGNFSNKCWPCDLPRLSEMMSLELRGMRCLLTFTYKWTAHHHALYQKTLALSNCLCFFWVEDLAKAALVDQLPHGLQGREAIGHVRLHQLQHVQDWLVHLKSSGSRIWAFSWSRKSE